MKINVNRKWQEHPELESRHVAATLLCELLTSSTPLDVCMARSHEYTSLSEQNRAFCLRLMQCTLKHFGQTKVAIANLMHTPLPAKFKYVDIQIAMAMAQIAAMDIPSYAAVNSAVELVKLHHSSHTALTNAILNKWIKEQGATLAHDHLLNIPDYLKNRWASWYRTNTIADMAQLISSETPLDITFKSLTLRSEWLAANHALNPIQIAESIRIYTPGMVSTIPGFKEGSWWVQDVAASLPVMLLGNIQGKKVLDVCAAPGGKTMQLAASGANVTALDSSKKRVETLVSNIARIGLTVDVFCADALKYTPQQPPDAVLLDAPCSATGTMRRNPDILLLRNKNNLFEQVEKQRKLLTRAVEMIPVGGVVVYAVCSLEKEEGEEQIAHLLNTRSDIIVDNESIQMPIELLRNEFGLRTLPNMHKSQGGMDGFFMTRLKKIKV